MGCRSGRWGRPEEGRDYGACYFSGCGAPESGEAAPSVHGRGRAADVGAERSGRREPGFAASRSVPLCMPLVTAGSLAAPERTDR